MTFMLKDDIDFVQRNTAMKLLIMSVHDKSRLEETDTTILREGLKDTPARAAKAWAHWLRGYEENPADHLKCFADGAEEYDELVVICDIPVFSHCEHHLAPFFGRACVGYVPQGKIVGLSKLHRLVDGFSRRLQTQERITTQIARTLMQSEVAPAGVGVILRCRHMCIESRGVAQQGTITSTSAMLGIFRDEPDARAEFLQLAKFEATI